MFGNLAALSWCTSHFAPSFQLQLRRKGSPIGLRCDPLSCILYFTACADCLSHITGSWNKSEPRLHFFFDRREFAVRFSVSLQCRQGNRLGAELVLMVV